MAFLLLREWPPGWGPVFPRRRVPDQCARTPARSPWAVRLIFRRMGRITHRVAQELRQAHDTEPHRLEDGLGAIHRVELLVDVGEVILHGFRTYIELGCYL